MPTARFTLAPASPLLSGVALTFDRDPLKEVEPIEADEQGGFRVELPKLFLNKSMVRRPGLVQFLPARWPFTGVVSAEVYDVELDESPTLRFRQGALLVEGWAKYTVLTEDGEEDTAFLPIAGRFVRMFPSLEEKLEGLQNPPRQDEGVGGGGDDRVKLLRELLGRVGEWGKPLVEEALALLQAGKPLDAETLKGIRYRMYRSDMSGETGAFKAASTLSELVASRHTGEEPWGGPLMLRRDYGSKTASARNTARRVAMRYAMKHG